MDDKCNCGREARYMHTTGDGEIVHSCNKYAVCPTYRELEHSAEQWRQRANKAEAELETLRKILAPAS